LLTARCHRLFAEAQLHRGGKRDPAKNISGRASLKQGTSKKEAE
jgi:hypothetical protein